jgi:hypothetical protein
MGAEARIEKHCMETSVSLHVFTKILLWVNPRGQCTTLGARGPTENRENPLGVRYFACFTVKAVNRAGQGVDEGPVAFDPPQSPD